MGLAYANPPFSLLAKVLTKIAYEGGRVVMCTPNPGCSREHTYWRQLLDRMTVGRVQLPNGPIYVPVDSDTAMQSPEWASFLSIVDRFLNPVPLCDLDQVLLKKVMEENRGLTLFDLKERSPEHLSATLTGCQFLDGDLEPAAGKEDADDQLFEIASVILVSICGGDIDEVTHMLHFCKIKSTKVPECTQCTMEVTRYTARAKFKSTSELLMT